MAALPKLAASSATFTTSLVAANAFVLGQAAWHHRPAVLFRPAHELAPKKRKRALSGSACSRDDARLDEHPNEPRHHHHHQDPHLPPPTRPPPPASAPASSSSSAPPTSKEEAKAPSPSRSTASSTPKSSSTPSPSPPPRPPPPSPRNSEKAEPTTPESDLSNFSLPSGWEDNPDYHITAFSQLPHRQFGYNQHIKINEEFKEALRQILWQFRAPIRYAFAYGSGVFGQKSSGSKGGGGSTAVNLSPHPNPPRAVEEWQKGGAKTIDFIFAVSHTQHWHSLNLTQHPDHYSALRYLPYSSAVVSAVQDRWGAGVYFNPYITVNGVMIKYGVANLDTLATDLSEWRTLYLAGRLQKPVKILRDDPRIRLAQQVNLISALRTALLMLPDRFTERELYMRIAALSYLGDPRMSFAAENPNKVSNIVGAQLPGFRQLYVPLIQNLPNVDFTDARTPGQYGWEKEDAIKSTGNIGDAGGDWLGGEEGLALSQDMSSERRGNMVRRLPPAFRRKLYFAYKKKFQIPGCAFNDVLEQANDALPADGSPASVKRPEGGDFERRIAEQEDLPQVISKCVKDTVSGPATSQTVKAMFTAGVGRAWRYFGEKRAKGKQAAGKEKAMGEMEEKKEKRREKSDG